MLVPDLFDMRKGEVCGECCVAGRAKDCKIGFLAVGVDSRLFVVSYCYIVPLA
jgi:hypothetical protein